MLSIIVPVFNEDESLVELCKQITVSCEKNDIAFETIFIDDGSSDKSWAVIEELSHQDNRYRGIRFRRNFGKAAALRAGMDDAQGELILMMDADLQDDPEEIPTFIEKLNKKSRTTHKRYDVINGWKKRRLDPWHKVYPSRVFNWMIGKLTGLKLHDHNCGLKLFRKEVAEEIDLYGELHRFIPVLAHARGFQVGELVVNHRSRQFGESKYGIKRFLRGFLDMITVSFLIIFGQRPLHMLGGIGLFLFGLGTAGMAYLAMTWASMNIFGIWEATPIGGRPLLAFSIAFQLLGAQAISLGLLAELVVAKTSKQQSTFSIAGTTSSSPDQNSPDGLPLETANDADVSNDSNTNKDDANKDSTDKDSDEGESPSLKIAV